MYVAVDAMQLEWRLAVEFSQDPVGIQEILDGGDLHSDNQQKFGLPSRLIAKIFLFRTIFRGSGWSFANDPAFTHVSDDPKFWEDMNDKFYKKYAGLDKCHEKWAEECHTTGKITGFTGRFWPAHFVEKKDWKTQTTKMVLHMPTMTNRPIQGTGNDFMAINRISLLNRMKKNKVPGMLVSTVHDSIVADTPEPDEVGKLMIEVFNDLPKNVEKLFGRKLAIPFPGEVKMGKNLLEMEKI